MTMSAISRPAPLLPEGVVPVITAAVHQRVRRHILTVGIPSIPSVSRGKRRHLNQEPPNSVTTIKDDVINVLAALAVVGAEVVVVRVVATVVEEILISAFPFAVTG
jgi:hypothetical protein